MKHKMTVLLPSLALVAILLAPGVSIAKNGPEYHGGSSTDSETWTLALFVNGDNNLEKYWDEISLPSLLLLPPNEGFKIVAFVDRYTVPGTEVFEISGDTYTKEMPYGEMNFGDGETFKWFLQQVDSNYDSDKLAVVMWDHGYAWRYISDDETDGGDRIEMPELEAAITGAGVYIDVLAFDACNMASIEVIYQVGLTGLVGIVVGSEESVPTTGYPYDLMFTNTASEPSRLPAELAADMVAGFQALYEGQTWASTVALSAVDVPALMAVADTLCAWTDEMRASLPDYEDEYALLVKETYSAWCTHYHVDIAALGDTILGNPAIADEGLRDATADMVAAVDGTVIASWGGAAALDARGMTLWWGVTGDWKFYSEAYEDVTYALDTGWFTFLDEYN